MASTSITIDTPASAVYASLLDAWTYEIWVGGTKTVRDVEATWPAVGSRFHHSIGVGPLMTRDTTKLLRAETDKLVELNVQLWPAGEGVVRLELEEIAGATRVTMHEDFIKGPLAWGDNKLQQLLVKVRNDWSLDKLRNVVEQRHHQAQS